GDGDLKVVPAESLGVLEMGNEHADGEPHGGDDHTDQRGDCDNDPGVMEPPPATAEPGRPLGGTISRESLQSQHVVPLHFESESARPHSRAEHSKFLPYRKQRVAEPLRLRAPSQWATIGTLSGYGSHM